MQKHSQVKKWKIAKEMSGRKKYFSPAGWISTVEKYTWGHYCTWTLDFDFFYVCSLTGGTKLTVMMLNFHITATCSLTLFYIKYLNISFTLYGVLVSVFKQIASYTKMLQLLFHPKIQSSKDKVHGF